ncbi:hypothetical protein Gorai_017657, partial [Gossypium raimondii]|nr:hypothetical protein [Gossypium raimondii]
MCHRYHLAAKQKDNSPEAPQSRSSVFLWNFIEPMTCRRLEPLFFNGME